MQQYKNVSIKYQDWRKKIEFFDFHHVKSLPGFSCSFLNKIILEFHLTLVTCTDFDRQIYNQLIAFDNNQHNALIKNVIHCLDKF